MLIYISLNLNYGNSQTVKVKFQDDGEWQDDSNSTPTIIVALLGQKL